MMKGKMFLFSVLFGLSLVAVLTASCPCPLHYDPVCGANGQTYGNPCAAQCVKIEIKCQYACPCRTDVDPTLFRDEQNTQSKNNGGISSSGNGILSLFVLTLVALSCFKKLLFLR